MQRLEGFQPRGQVRLLAGFVVKCLLRLAALLIQLRHLFLQFAHTRLQNVELLATARQLCLQMRQLFGLGRSQGVAVSQQAIAPLALLAHLLVDAALLGRQHLNLLLHLRHAAALLIGLLLRVAQSVFQRGQLLGLLLHLRFEDGGLLFQFHVLCGLVFDFLLGFVLALLPVAALFGQLQQALFGALAVFHHEADFCLKLAHFGRDFVQQALRHIDLIARRVMCLANGFQLGFDMTHIGHAAFEVGTRFFYRHAHLILIGRRIRPFEVPQLVQTARARVLQGLVFLCDFGLLFELFEIGVELAQNVFHPREVLVGIGQTVFGLAAALFVFADAGGFFQKQAQLFGAAFDDAADGALPDDGVGTRPQARAQKHVLHVAAAHGLVVDEIAAATLAREYALDGNFGKLAPLAARAVVGIVKHQLHTAAAGGFARGGAVENHVLHGLATQLAGFAFAQYPTHGIHDVGLAATIGADHADTLPRQREVGGFCKRFETGKFDGCQAHGSLFRIQQQGRADRLRAATAHCTQGTNTK